MLLLNGEGGQERRARSVWPWLIDVIHVVYAVSLALRNPGGGVVGEGRASVDGRRACVSPWWWSYEGGREDVAWYLRKHGWMGWIRLPGWLSRGKAWVCWLGGGRRALVRLSGLLRATA